ncbi:heterokaryon incompatibility protein-domain-containing protein, partial [Apiosordaria backusii]
MALSPLPTNAKYNALSYCWDQSNRHFLATKANISELQAVRDIASVWDQLPGAIQDAIDCVPELGHEFLWVDALCIIQDDDDDKAEQIKQMDRVYDSALPTIISAYGSIKKESTPNSMSCDGLPGYRPYSIDRHRCQSTALTSHWATRAWTFQEQLLSKRRLFFTNTQLYFQCSCGVFCEDVIGWAYIQPHSSLYNERSLYHDHTLPYDRNADLLPRNRFSGREEAFQYYGQVIDAYTRRNMTDQGDALAALEGIL